MNWPSCGTDQREIENSRDIQKQRTALAETHPLTNT
jgi:hypothetical protein